MMTSSSRSLKKRTNKKMQPNSKPKTSRPSSASSSMDFLSRFGCRKNPTVILASLAICVIVILSLTSGTLTKFASVYRYHIYSIEVINEFPHDPRAFTQGLLYAGNDTLYESTGLYGHSSLRKVALETGKVEAFHKMDDSYFGEGLTLLGERLFQVTWLKQTGFIYDRTDFSKVKEFTHQMKDGWGLATDENILYGTDGTSTLYHIDPQTLKVVRKQKVKYNNREVRNLNELEFINGEVWANVWQTDCIARISPEDGTVRAWILLPKLREGLVAAGHKGIDLLNGIAWDSKKDRLFVTGKLWPKLYEIKVHPMTKQLDEKLIEKLCVLDGML